MAEGPQNPIMDTFDDASAWGVHRPSGATAILLRLCHTVPPALPGGRRLALWLRHPLKHRLRGPVDTEAWGLKLRLMPRGNLSESRWLFMPQFIDRAEREFMRAHLPADGTFIDIGANAGLYSLWAAGVCLTSGGRVLAVEPDPELQRRITFNRDLNQLDNLDILPCALDDAEGKASLVLGGRNRGENRIADSATGETASADAVSVPVRTLTGLLQERSIERIDGLKIDIEGREHAVMRQFFDTAPESLWPRFLIFETCTEAQAESMHALAAAKGYRTAARGRLNTIAETGGRTSL